MREAAFGAPAVPPDNCESRKRRQELSEGGRLILLSRAAKKKRLSSFATAAEKRGRFKALCMDGASEPKAFRRKMRAVCAQADILLFRREGTRFFPFAVRCAPNRRLANILLSILGFYGKLIIGP